MKYNDSGKVTADKIIRSQIAPSNATIGYDGIAYWITANDLIQKTGFPDKRQSFFLSLNQKLQPVTTILASNGLNTAVRSQYNRKGATIMSGHYQDLLQIGKDSIQNDGHHALFVVGF